MSLKRVPLSNLNRLAAEHRGTCLTEGEADTTVLYAAFQCEKGHSWRAAASKVIAGGWCPKCGKAKPRLTIEDMRAIARDRGGKCLSETYLNVNTKLEWECTRGHRWRTDAHCIRKGTWCPKCKHESQKNTIEDMRRLAARHGGKCLSRRYVNNATHLRWQCARGHAWRAQPANITMGQWCPRCNLDRKRLSLQEIHKVAGRRGGRCLSSIYRGNSQKLLWECKEGHRWRAAVNNVRNNGSWCPYCARNRPYDLRDIRKVAADRGGACNAGGLMETLSRSEQEIEPAVVWV